MVYSMAITVHFHVASTVLCIFGKPRDLTRGVTLLGEVAEIPVLKNEEMGA